MMQSRSLVTGSIRCIIPKYLHDTGILQALFIIMMKEAAVTVPERRAYMCDRRFARFDSFCGNNDNDGDKCGVASVVRSCRVGNPLHYAGIHTFLPSPFQRDAWFWPDVQNRHAARVEDPFKIGQRTTLKCSTNTSGLE